MIAGYLAGPFAHTQAVRQCDTPMKKTGDIITMPPVEETRGRVHRPRDRGKGYCPIRDTGHAVRVLRGCAYRRR